MTIIITFLADGSWREKKTTLEDSQPANLEFKEENKRPYLK